MRLLLDAGTDPRVPDAALRTPLHGAVAAAHREVAQVLLHKGKQPMSKQHGGLFSAGLLSPQRLLAAPARALGLPRPASTDPPHARRLHAACTPHARRLHAACTPLGPRWPVRLRFSRSLAGVIAGYWPVAIQALPPFETQARVRAPRTRRGARHCCSRASSSAARATRSSCRCSSTPSKARRRRCRWAMGA